MFTLNTVTNELYILKSSHGKGKQGWLHGILSRMWVQSRKTPKSEIVNDWLTNRPSRGFQIHGRVSHTQKSVACWRGCHERSVKKLHSVIYFIIKNVWEINCIDIKLLPIQSVWKRLFFVKRQISLNCVKKKRKIIGKFTLFSNRFIITIWFALIPVTCLISYLSFSFFLSFSFILSSLIRFFCLSVCLSVCVSVCLFSCLYAIFECLNNTPNVSSKRVCVNLYEGLFVFPFTWSSVCLFFFFVGLLEN